MVDTSDKANRRTRVRVGVSCAWNDACAERLPLPSLVRPVCEPPATYCQVSSEATTATMLSVLLGLAAMAPCIICGSTNRSAAASQDVSAGQFRTLYGSYEEKLVQMHAYHKLKGAIKAEARECHRRSLCQVARVFGSHKSSHSGLRHFLEAVAQLPGSLPAAFAKGWLGQDCQVAYRSCDVAKAYTKRIIAAMLSIEPPPPDATT